MGPNGNGAVFEAVNANETVKGILQESEYVQIIGVDNVLNRILDPVYIGFTVAKGLDASMKSCVKRDAKEPVGVLVKRGGNKYDIIEYSEFSEADATAVVPETGELKYNLGNILVFLLKSEKLLDLASNNNTMNQLYHKAFKKIGYYDPETKTTVSPKAPNAWKFELFIHNFLPFCEPGKLGVLKVKREEEFGPVKNAEGVDSPQSARELIYSLSKQWLHKLYPDVQLSSPLEVDTLLSYEGEGLDECLKSVDLSTLTYIDLATILQSKHLKENHINIVENEQAVHVEDHPALNISADKASHPLEDKNVVYQQIVDCGP